MKNKTILLGHGSGGQLSHELIKNLFVKNFSNRILDQQSDSAVLSINNNLLTFTTDSFVVDPIFFPGGNIGNLAVAGTVNDLAVSGAKPLYLSSSFIIEEGFDMDKLEEIVKTMSIEAEKANIKIVTGDTKVVDKGKCDKVFINTAGIGLLPGKNKNISSGKDIIIGDKIIINGSIGDHGMAILSARNELNIKTNIQSDCACLNHMIDSALLVSEGIKFMRDATRGGIATVLSELVEDKQFGIEIDESTIDVKENVRGICELLGFDPFYVANEGKAIFIVAEEDASKVLAKLKSDELGKNAAIIGEITKKHPGKAWIKTSIGGKRIIDMLAGEQLPRIC
ncbi:MAG: hydrogenase expression/formation protein HypE [Bacteroidetes bacterium]|jgi:hydrogenase expression/formation protein HypE|nr:hydrogenase expression/formation protein HypE [Bacteroidota bacterium]MBT6686370.1 hydrogenase expression/formation protein HypE [Bacteroidota bacterium]MBT7142203.1 hydrogenase expression/formation protein HypE [Bacteroidota bacterium]MBT7490442.1 hydrogenase expression/formation protein HypE [Bacteroidota bacterium]